MLSKVSQEDCEEHWTKQYDSSAKTCSHAFWKGNCRNKTIGIECEVGLRKKSYNVLTGSTTILLQTKNYNLYYSRFCSERVD